MSYLQSLSNRENFKTNSEAYEYIVEAYLLHDSYANYIRHVNKLDKQERANFSEYIIRNHPYIKKEQLILLIMALIDHPTKVD